MKNLHTTSYTFTIIKLYYVITNNTSTLKLAVFYHWRQNQHSKDAKQYNELNKISPWILKTTVISHFIRILRVNHIQISSVYFWPEITQLKGQSLVEYHPWEEAYAFSCFDSKRKIACLSRIRAHQAPYTAKSFFFFNWIMPTQQLSFFFNNKAPTDSYRTILFKRKKDISHF